ncbi:lipoprotein [Leptospira interrogans]|uniref:lipoprotein n=1 Tax=Leptospira interrogans TaxID=173 RepID=UPI0010C0376A|nr:lipoprotein [Leptospira interrogans]KAA1269105.1 lipoprotein [Leptospira interrogans serovar Weerasinghe]QCO42248.1 lipoprotein [Leptospira interrogans]ULG80961.1 lipoprotein [Leptospira interrogans]UML68585.1 lipoprotein [Leptospira interrogans]UML71906.1 lipoprotein [Leptospira interrogans]
MNQIFYKIIILFFTSIILNGCVIFGNKTARAAEKAATVKANYQIGYIENRDFRFDPFRIKNFISLLKFEIIRNGNGLVEEEPETSKTNPPTPVATSNPMLQNPEATTTAPSTTTPETPKPTTTTSTETNSSKDSKRIFMENEIKNLSSKVNFDYYLQGSFGMSDNGSILDRNFTTLIFLDVHDKTGKLVKSVSYTQDSKNFSDADDLKQASISLVDKIMKKSENK